ncbi:MAG TPA: ATP-binding protein [Phycisphaerae bacterium]|nr:ATP-binding protein [Phycisphaerae bacterium]HRW53683.1 ATP-binding protein [Phycisphaerae bacterium]
MSELKLKPWQIDEPLVDEELSPPDKATKATAEAAPLDLGAAPARAPGRVGRFNVSMAFVIAPVVGAMLIVLFIDVAPFSSEAGVRLWAKALAAGLSGLGAAMAAWNAMARRRSMRGVLVAMQGLTNGNKDVVDASSLPRDLRPVWKAIEAHSQRVGEGLRQLTDMQRKLQLDLTLSETNRRRTLAVIRAMSEPVLVTDPFDQIVLANPAIEELLGFREEEALRKNVDSVVQDEHILETIRETRSADARAADRRREVFVGDRVFLIVTAPLNPSQNKEGSEGNTVVTILRDITREHETARKKSEFVAHVAHELRTPLSSIRAYVEMLVDGEADDPETRKEYYDIIQTSAERLGRLIDNMLNISRIEAGTVRINREPIGVAMIVKEAVDMMRPSAEEKNIELTDNLTPAMFQVDADRDLIYQAVLNLISNAIKYTPNEGKVTVSTVPQEERHRILIQIEDTGAGIPKEDLPKMFEKFFRVEANKKMAKGTGLGLNLVKKIVEDVHSGEVLLASEVGVGSTFTIALPVVGR